MFGYWFTTESGEGITIWTYKGEEGGLGRGGGRGLLPRTFDNKDY